MEKNIKTIQSLNIILWFLAPIKWLAYLGSFYWFLRVVKVLSKVGEVRLLLWYFALRILYRLSKIFVKVTKEVREEEENGF